MGIINPIIGDLRKNNGQYRIATTGKDKLYDDALEGLLKFLPPNETDIKRASAFSRNSPEFLEAARLSASSKTPTQIIKRYIQNLLNMSDQEFNPIYQSLEKGWKSGLIDFLYDAAASALSNGQPDVLLANREAYLSFSENQWHLTTVLSQISLKLGDEEQSIAGTLETDFVLTGDAFQWTGKLRSSNPFLERLCASEHIELTPQLLAKLKEEAEFQAAVDDLQANITELNLNEQVLGEKDERKEPAKAILDEVLRLKAKVIDAPPLQDLKKILTTMEKLTRAKKQMIKENDLTTFDALTKKMGAYSWGKILAGAMLCFIGAVLAIGSCVAMATSFGLSAPLSGVGAIAGGTLFAGGCVLLFQGVKEKPIEKKMRAFRNVM